MFRICREYRETEFSGKQSLCRAVFWTLQASLRVENSVPPIHTGYAADKRGTEKEERILTAEAAGSFPYRHQLNNVPDLESHTEYADSF